MWPRNKYSNSPCFSYRNSLPHVWKHSRLDGTLSSPIIVEDVPAHGGDVGLKTFKDSHN